MSKYRVLVVDDSALMRKMVSDMISEHPQFEVAAIASNGKEAVEKTLAYKPDVITMDVEMPEINGLEALRQIMEKCPTPVIMLSSLTQTGAQETVKALEWGAVDFIPKPSGSISLDIYKVREILHEKLMIAVQARLSPLPQGGKRVLRMGGSSLASPLVISRKSPLPSAKRQFTISQIVAIGTSTGGPKALQRVLTQLPAHFPAPILIVQHMPAQFTTSLARRLDSICRIRVVEAEDRFPLQTGTAYIAPGGWHMKLDRRKDGRYQVILDQEPPRFGHRPSVDVLFESLVPFTELRRIAVLMTGMGSDGAKGMQTLYQAGAKWTIAESEETSVIFGMPKAAIALNCVQYVLPLHRIAEKLCDLVLT